MLKLHFRESSLLSTLFSLVMATSLPSSSATTSLDTDQHDAVSAIKPELPSQDYSPAENYTPSRQPGSAPPVPPDELLDPFLASSRVWQAIPQDARRAFLNYPTPPASPRQSSRSPRRTDLLPNEYANRTERLPEGTSLMIANCSTSSSTTSSDATAFP